MSLGSSSGSVSESSFTVQTEFVSSITSSAPSAIYFVRAGSAIKIFPTSAGAATVYSSTSPKALALADVTAGAAAILAGTNASWDIWGAGAVTAKTTQSATVPLTAVAVVVTSGTWTMEVCAG